MRCVIPESIFTRPRGQVDARSWDAALNVVQQSLLGMAVANEVKKDGEDRVLIEVFLECEEEGAMARRPQNAISNAIRCAKFIGGEGIHAETWQTA
jgi:hypothetical protein